MIYIFLLTFIILPCYHQDNRVVHRDRGGYSQMNLVFREEPFAWAAISLAYAKAG